MDREWLTQALRLAADHSLCKGALDVAHVLGDTRLYHGEKDAEKQAWDALREHLQRAVVEQGEST